ncbi:MAG: MFS transporter [Candidatus Bipolaricaulota bacterium]|nr:MFS transporter [Candidatus Bipolaricaulota bacterium]MCS7274001.1 MFS transporter [Candidatus Bipolaricaulota bacterium]MDW8111354.1 MFS transporter [Candidatus Bipolaricaulota bacterium]MDW8329226.1 MFS transporter [Candidatus Bipolaricaulota bacterium]
MKPQAQAPRAWLNRNVWAMTITSFLSDAGHETATTILPQFLHLLGAPAAILGVIEGVSDAIASFSKLGAGWYSDRIGHRKAISTFGYFLTGITKALFAFAVSWPLVLIGRVLGWFGRGIRGPLRDAILAESVPEESRGRAFGFQRAGDTLGAIVGPVGGVALLALLAPYADDPTMPFRTVFLVTLVPGLGAALVFGLFVRERRRAPNHQMRLWATVRALPDSYRRFLVGVGVFGAGDFAHTMLILAATQLLTPAYGLLGAAQIAAMLFVVRNLLYAAAAYPVGALSDRVGRRALLALGYLLGALVSCGVLLAFLASVSSLFYLGMLFALAGVYIAVEDTLEGALTADLVPNEGVRGVAYGVLGTINGVGDFIASAVVGLLWTALSPVVAFGYAALLMAAGALILSRD